MANSFTLPNAIAQGLDEVYAAALLSADLLGDNADVKSTGNAKQIAIPKIAFGKGVQQYTRANGYSATDITVTNEVVSVNYDVGNKFVLDACDEEECKIQAARALAEFERVHAAKAKDQFTFSALAAGGTTPVAAALSTGADWLAAIRTGVDAMENAEVTGDKILYITPAGLGLIQDLDTTKSREVLASFSKVVKVPSGRFFTNAVADSTNGNYKKDTSSGKDIHFMIVEKSAVIDYEKRTISEVITPEANQTADGYIMKYRKVAYVDVYENKASGVYTHTAA